MQETVDVMLKNKFDFMGVESNYGKFYEGFEYAGTLSLLLVMVLLWLLSDSYDAVSKKVLTCLAVFMVLWAIMELIYFFPMVAAFTFIAAILTSFAISKFNKTAEV